MGKLYIHGFSKSGNGVAITGSLQSAEFLPSGWNRVSYFSRLYWNILTGRTSAVLSQIGVRNSPQEDISWGPTVQLGLDCRHDEIRVGKAHSVRLTTDDVVAVSDYSVLFQPGGER